MSNSFWKEVSEIGVVVTDNKYTHIDLATGDKYFIPRKMYKSLFKLYNEYRECNPRVNIAEHSKDNMPVVIHFDFESNNITERLSDDLISKIVKVSQLCIVKYVPDHFDNGSLSCYVLDSDERDRSNIIVHFPNVFLTKHIQMGKLIPDIRSALMKVNDSLKSKWDTIVDLSYIDRDVPMYGSSLNEGEDPKTWKYFCRYSGNAYDDAVLMEPPNGYSLSTSSYVRDNIINMNDYDEDRHDDWTHIILSVHTYNEDKQKIETSTKPIKDIFSEKEKKEASRIKFSLSSFYKRGEKIKSGEDCDSDVQLVPEFFLAMWNPARINNMAEWKTIGEAIYNFYRDNDIVDVGCILWHDETKKMIDKYAQKGHKTPQYFFDKDGREYNLMDMCDLHYYQFKTGRIDVHNLAYVASLDSPKEFQVWHTKWCKSALIDAISGFHVDVGIAFYKVNFLNVVCECNESKKHTIYIFRRHRLVCDYSNTRIKRMLTGDFVRKIRQMETDIVSQLENANSKNREYGDNIKAKISSLIGKLKTNTYIWNVIDASCTYFHKDNLSSFLDENPDLTCVKSGVLVATTTEIFIRPGRPQDFITKETDATYNDFSWDHPYVGKVVAWAKQTFIDPDLVKFWFRFLSSLLRGGNSDKIFPVLYGPEGDNSKSAWVRAIYKAMGPYCYKGTMSMLTNEDRNTNGPTPLLVKFKATRIVFFEESEGGGKPMEKQDLLKI